MPDGSVEEVELFRFLDLSPDHVIRGPAIVEYPGSTLFIPPEWTAVYDERSNARLARPAKAR
jgi:N-methylhydantoinase A